MKIKFKILIICLLLLVFGSTVVYGYWTAEVNSEIKLNMSYKAEITVLNVPNARIDTEEIIDNMKDSDDKKESNDKNNSYQATERKDLNKDLEESSEDSNYIIDNSEESSAEESNLKQSTSKDKEISADNKETEGEEGLSNND